MSAEAVVFSAFTSIAANRFKHYWIVLKLHKLILISFFLQQTIICFGFTLPQGAVPQMKMEQQLVL